MKYLNTSPGVIILEDGTTFYGKSAGLKGTATGEICFNTGMTGYQEIYTDPSYLGQIIVCTTAHIGNYGVNENEVESDAVKINGLICKKFASVYSRTMATDSLQHYFESNNIVAISDIDTRALVRYIRDKGAMNVIISSEVEDIDKLKNLLKETPSMQGLELSSKVSTKIAYDLGDVSSPYKVAVLDYGTKKNILSCLTDRNCSVRVFPMNTELDEIKKWGADGIMLSNGPGDPSSMMANVEIVKSFVESGIPIFGICLGHQLLGLSYGLKTLKMHTGHRGINHPVKNLLTTKGEITSQNHGFVVDVDSLSLNSEVEMTHVHLNDNSLAGMKLKNKPVFSVQYHPESSPGPHDSRYLFDDFIDLIKQHKN
jgi:carbamoyl-phosphate synthase small subunit